MKKALPLIMAALVASSMAGCGNSKTEATTAAEDASVEETTEAEETTAE